MADAPAQKHTEAIDFVLVIALCVWVTIILLVLAFVEIPKENQVLFGSVAGGGVIGGMTLLLNNRWGSSKSSAAKDDTIAAIATKNA